jgi:hypothetical protein
MEANVFSHICGAVGDGNESLRRVIDFKKCEVFCWRTGTEESRVHGNHLLTESLPRKRSFCVTIEDNTG